MGKLDELMKASRGIATESMGTVRPPVATSMHGAAAPVATTAPDRLQGIVRTRNAAEIPLVKIGPDADQPREEFDPEAIRRLADSLKARGQLQPIRVRWDEGRGLYVIVCGERRWRAAELAGLETMTCVIMEGPITSADLLAVQLIENCVREDLKPIEQARAFKALMDQNGWSTRKLADELAVTQSNVVRALAMLSLPGTVQEQVEQGGLSPATAYELSKVGDPEAQAELAARVVEHGLTRDETAAAVRESKATSARPKGRGAGRSRKLTSRVFRTAAGRATVELKKGSGREAIRDVLRDALQSIEAELEADQRAA